MKKILFYTLFFCAASLFGGCDDFFEVETDNVLDSDKYISEESEIYTGFMGIISKMQAIGDKSIYINEMRGESMEPTASSPKELYSLYNYDADLTGNDYADPAGYYELINETNDYLKHMKAYKEEYSVDETTYKALVSSAVRIQVWTYMTLAKIYGKVVWVDKPMTSLRDLTKFKELNLDETMLACKNLLDFGFDDVEPVYTTSWKAWLDPDGSEQTSEFRYWDLVTPPYFCLYAEVCLWLGKYQKCIDIIQSEMNGIYEKSNGQSVAYLRNDQLLGKFINFWSADTPYAYEACSAILYDAAHHQTNSLLKHFDSDYPNKYWIAPSQVAYDRFTDNDFTPLGVKTQDFRMNGSVAKYNGNLVCCKYRAVSGSARDAYKDHVHIYTYRGADLYLMMAEAFNQLGKTEAVKALINVGIGDYIDEFENNGAADPVYSGTWYGFTPNWTTVKCIYKPTGGNPGVNERKYGDRGLRGSGSTGMSSRTFTSDIKANDEELLKEAMLEYCGEGRVYPIMIRMARRHGDTSFLTKYICEKYKSASIADAVRAKLESGDYFVPWDLKNTAK